MEPRRYFGGPMDAGRYMPRHGGWDSNSAVESYKGAPDAEVRAGEAYGGRNFLESGVSQDNAYSRGTLHRDPFVERDGFQMPPQPAVGMWPDARRKTLEEELAILRNAPRHDKGGGYFEGYNQVGDFRESDKFPRQIDYYHNRGSNVHDHGSFRDTDGYRRADKFHDAEGYRNVDMFHEVDGYCKSDKFPEAEGYRNADKFQEAEGYRNSTKFQEPEGYCNAEKFQEAEGYRNSAKFQEAEGYRNSAKFQEAEGYRNSAKFQEVEGYRSTAKFQELEGYRSTAKFQESEGYRTADKFHEVDGFRDHGYERTGRFPIQERNVAADDDFDYRNKSHERSRSRDFEYSRHDENSSDYERGKRDRKRRRPRDREQERGRSRERERSIDRDRYRERSRSYSHDDHRWRSISPYIHSRGRREYSDDESRSEIRYERSTKKRDHDAKGYNNDRSAVAPSATLVVRGLSQKTVEDDLYHALKDWGPLRHVRVIKEKSSGVSRGFAFIDFPSVDAAQKMMADIGEKGVVVDGRCLFFEYSSKPTGGVGSLLVASASSTQGSASSAPKGSTPIAAAAVDWTCNVCGCVNFARRTSCFQCNEARTEDALPGDAATSNHTSSRKAGEAGPTHVLVVRGLDEYVNEEDLHYEFSKHAPIKDLRLVRDKFTHVSRGFAFIHFHSVEDATKALESSNGKALEKNGNVLRVAYAKSIHGPGANASSSQASSLAAAAIEAATFAQQYDQVGWAPKEYNPDQENKRAQEGNGTSEGGTNPGPSTATGIHPGFVWDEASGYYYDAASGFYYDHHRALYYDGNNSIWYTYNYETQQYEPYADQSGGAVAGMKNTTIAAKARIEKASEASTKSKAVISAPPATIHEPAFPAAVQAAASAANASTRKEREKEIRLASKGLLLAGKKRMSSNISVWKQRKQDTQAAVIAETPSLAKTSTASVSNEKREPEAVVSTVSTSSTTVPLQAKIGTKKLEGVIHTKEGGGGGGATTSRIKNISGKLSGTIYGGKYSTPEALASLRQQVPPTAPSDIGDPTGFGKGNEPLVTTSTQQQKQQIASESISTSTPFKTGLSALGGPSGSNAGGAGGRRRFMEAPQPGTYRDRAAERRSLYGS